MNAPAQHIVVSGGFDDLRSRQVRFLQEASQLGPLTVSLWSDEMLLRETGKAPRFPFSERLYYLRALSYVSRSIPACSLTLDELPASVWVEEVGPENEARQAHFQQLGMEYRALTCQQLAGFPTPAPTPANSVRKKVVVTGSFDWLHSGHVRFFEEASDYGELYVIVGHDANIRLLKGEGHPLLPQDERLYMVASIKYVKQALISSGDGWLDADPEIKKIQPAAYIVNEDGDKGGKREYCQRLGIEYLALTRKPATGLPKRSSTDLRGF